MPVLACLSEDLHTCTVITSAGQPACLPVYLTVCLSVCLEALHACEGAAAEQ